MKVVINRCFGGFSVSKEAYEFMGLEWDGYGYLMKYEEEKYGERNTPNNLRTDPKLIECVETLGKLANGRLAELKVVKIPDDVEWYITEYDGLESVEEVHRIWC